MILMDGSSKPKAVSPSDMSPGSENPGCTHDMPSPFLGTKNTEAEGRKYSCLYGTYSLMRNKYALYGPLLGHSGLKRQELCM